MQTEREPVYDDRGEVVQWSDPPLREPPTKGPIKVTFRSGQTAVTERWRFTAAGLWLFWERSYWRFCPWHRIIDVEEVINDGEG